MYARSLLLRAAVAVAVLGGVTLVGTSAAGASPVDPAGFTCGNSVFTACNQTAHYSTPNPTGGGIFGGPSPNATNCQSYIQTDALEITGTGQGVEHSIINKSGDGWFTSTFTGNVTVVPWTADNEGNPIAPDPAAPTVTGHITLWFGGSFNAKNFVLHDTINFSGTAPDGSPATFHAVDHTSLPAATGAAPVDFHVASC